jgi:hypothetical protein
MPIGAGCKIARRIRGIRRRESLGSRRSATGTVSSPRSAANWRLRLPTICTSIEASGIAVDATYAFVCRRWAARSCIYRFFTIVHLRSARALTWQPCSPSHPCTVSGMNKISCALILVTAALIFVPTWAKATTPINTLTSATGAANFDNGNYGQDWSWNTADGTSMTFESAGSTSMDSELVAIIVDGTANTTGGSSGGLVINANVSGTNLTTYGLYAEASNGTAHTYGVAGQTLGTNAGDAGVWGSDAGCCSSVPTSGVYGISGSSAGYGGFFQNINGGYAAAFMGANVGIGTATPLNLLDIGTSGGIHIGSGVPSATSMALYNNSGTLTWNGVALATGSSVSGTTNYAPFSLAQARSVIPSSIKAGAMSGLARRRHQPHWISTRELLRMYCFRGIAVIRATTHCL